ncbi:unnamed protein product [Cuscuta epithymum]|uniref:C2H2-type domain-containing protein n=1 Tax=Cuscuta epithymum TaxID=186058 RepID=A0AAV0DGL7_9ASTE|nr:unnamed protein product [Cuscuta epithymum]
MASHSAGGEFSQQSEPAVRPKRKRNLPGMPDPDAEVVALSPKSLMETNKYVCDICGKGFQRDQNLQLHRRGHNLPWKLKQRPAGNELRKRVYVCPEPNCAHHDPSRALGDLTGIKKHFCRKHGEKKFKCERCNKSYAVLCDWKAHMKVCGTREYPCDCGTVFSRRDSFITHRAFCDALAQESARSSPGGLTVAAAAVNPKLCSSSLSPPPQPVTPSTAVLSPVLSIQSSGGTELPENQSVYSHQKKNEAPQRGGSSTSSCNLNWNSDVVLAGSINESARGQVSSSLGLDGDNNRKDIPRVFGLVVHNREEPNVTKPAIKECEGDVAAFAGFIAQSSMMSLSLSTTAPLYSSTNSASLFMYDLNHHQQQQCTPSPPLSATALLQKAAQIGSKSSTSFLQGLGLTMSSDDSVENREQKLPGLSLGLHSSPSMVYGSKPPTLDFLGLGGNHTSSDEYPVLLSSMNGRDHFSMASSSFGGILGGSSWEDSSDQKPGFL